MADLSDRHSGFDDDRLLAHALGLDPDPELEAALEGDDELGCRLQAVQADLDDVEVGLDRLVPAPDESYTDPSAARWDGLRPSFTPPPERRPSRGRWRVLVPVLAATLAIAVVGAFSLDLGGGGEAALTGDRAASTAESAQEGGDAAGGLGAPEAATPGDGDDAVGTLDPPAWLLEEARRMARALDDPHPDAVYWGYVPLGTLETMTGASWPDPTLMRYVLVFEGQLSTSGVSTRYGVEIPDRSPLAWAVYQAEDPTASSFGMYLGDGLPPAVPEGLHAFSL